MRSSFSVYKGRLFFSVPGILPVLSGSVPEKIYGKLCVFVFVNRSDGVAGNLKYRDPGYTVIGKLQFSLLRGCRNAIYIKGYLTFCPHTTPAGKRISLTFQSCQSWKRFDQMMSETFCDFVSTFTGTCNGRGAGTFARITASPL